MWKYCPLCAGKLENQQKNFHGTCSNCGQNWYKSPRPTVAAVIYKKQNPSKVLFTKRAIKPKKDLLDLPGGFIESTETPKKAMLREAKEELNVELQEVKFLTHILSKYTYQKTQFNSLNTIYTATIKSTKNLTPQDDVSEIIWLDIKNKIPSLAFPPLESSLKLHLKNIQEDKVDH